MESFLFLFLLSFFSQSFSFFSPFPCLWLFHLCPPPIYSYKHFHLANMFPISIQIGIVFILPTSKDNIRENVIVNNFLAAILENKIALTGGNEKVVDSSPMIISSYITLTMVVLEWLGIQRGFIIKQVRLVVEENAKQG